jgi:hypothetical protein
MAHLHVFRCVNTKNNRVFCRIFDYFERNVFRPIRAFKVTMNHLKIQQSFICTCTDIIIVFFRIGSFRGTCYFRNSKNCFIESISKLSIGFKINKSKSPVKNCDEESKAKFIKKSSLSSLQYLLFEIDCSKKQLLLRIEKS